MYFEISSATVSLVYNLVSLKVCYAQSGAYNGKECSTAVFSIVLFSSLYIHPPAKTSKRSGKAMVAVLCGQQKPSKFLQRKRRALDSNSFTLLPLMR